MKKLQVTVLLLLIWSSFFAQATKHKATIIFKDGTELPCFARVSGDNIRYVKENKRDAEIVVNEEEVKGVKIWLNDNLIQLFYKKEQGKGRMRLMELANDGKMKIYRISDVYGHNIGFDTNKAYFKRKSASTVYFLESKSNPEEVFRFRDDFIKNAKDHFSDCTILTNKIGKDGFRKKDLMDMVIFYNDNCAK